MRDETEAILQYADAKVCIAWLLANGLRIFLCGKLLTKRLGEKNPIVLTRGQGDLFMQCRGNALDARRAPFLFPSVAVAIAVYLVGLFVYGIYHLIKKIASPKKAKIKEYIAPA